MLKLNAGTNSSTDIEQRETDTTIIRRRGSTEDTVAPARYTLPAPLYGIEKLKKKHFQRGFSYMIQA